MKTTKSLPPLSTQRALSWTWQVEDGLVLPGNAETRSKSAVLHAPRPDRAIDPKILDSYVGGYEVAPGLVVKVRRVGNQLIGQPGEQTPAEFVPATDTEFYVIEGPVKIVFEKDAAGVDPTHDRSNSPA